MAAEIRLGALCDHALVGQDGKVSILGIFRNISVSSLPAEHPRMYLVAILSMDQGQHAVTIRLRRPDGSQAMPDAPQLTVAANAGQDVNVIVELNKIQFNALGTHQFDVEVDGQIAGTLPVAILQMEQGATGRRAN